MPAPNYEKRRVPQNPRDGKHERRYSEKVRSATDSMESDDVQDFDRQGHPGEPHRDVEPSIMDNVNPISIIANYSRLGEGLKQAGNFRKVAMEIARIAEMAESTVMEEAGDWFDGQTIKRNMSELKKHAGAFSKIAEELDMMQQRASALYDDMGNVLTRYFELSPMTDADDANERAFDPKHKAPEFDGPGGNPHDDEGRKKHDAQDGVLDDTAPPALGSQHTSDIHPGDDSDMGDSSIGMDDEDDEVVEGIVNRVMERILPSEAQFPRKLGGKQTKTSKTAATKSAVRRGAIKRGKKQHKEFGIGKEAAIAEKGEPTPERARKALRTPDAFSRPHQGLTHDQAKTILRRTGVREIGEAQRVLAKVQEAWMQRKESAFRDITESKTAGKVDGEPIDLFEGSAVVKVLNTLAGYPKRREHYMSMSPRQMVTFAFKLLR